MSFIGLTSLITRLSCTGEPRIKHMLRIMLHVKIKYVGMETGSIPLNMSKLLSTECYFKLKIWEQRGL